jgi:outer membrane protein assembly factor BamA
MIQQKAGEPFSGKAVRASLEALQQTNEFSMVQVSVQPETGGLKILFILEPTSYIGIVSFPGVTGHFQYTRLLQAVNISEQTPYTADLLPQGQKALLHFFQVNGYFMAAVTPSIERDDPHRIVNLVFTVQLGKLARVGNLEFKGLSSEESERAQRDLRSFWAKLKRDSLKPGSKYSQQRIEKAVNYVRGELRNQGKLAPVVRLADSDYDPASNRANLSFQVDPGPQLSVQVTGTHVSQRTIKRLVPIFEENSVDSDLVDEGRRNLISYFQAKGYFDVKIETQFDQQPDKVTVTYQVDRGSRHRVENVEFDGNHYLNDGRLRAVVSVKKGRTILRYTVSRGSFSDQLLQKSVDAITALYKDAGFSMVSVNPQVKDFNPLVDVTFQISEGQQDKIASVRIEGNEHESLRALAGPQVMNLAAGKPYSPRLLQSDRNRILATYLDLGYLDARLQTTVTPEADHPHLFNVVYTVTEGPQGHVSNVVLLGEKTTKPRFIEKITKADLSTGKPLSEGKFFAAEGDLYNLGIFDWASVKPLRPVTTQNEEEVLVKVHESQRYSLDIGGGIEVIPRSGNIPVGTVALPGLPPVGLGSHFTVSQKSFFGPRFSFSIAKHNLRGKAETATFSTVISRLDQSGSFTYTDPYLRGTSWSSLFSLTAERTTSNPLYTAELGQASFQLQKNLDAKKTKHLIFRYSFQRTDLSNILIPGLVLPADQRVRTSTVSTEYVRDTRDKPLDAHHGVYQTLDVGVTPTAFGSSANFVRFLGQSAFYIPARPWLTWANRIQLGLATPFADSSVPLSERFFTGGADSLRGFPINGAGPQRPVSVCSNPSDPTTCTLISVPIGGEMLFILNSEARFPIPGLVHGLGGVVFYDGGNVYSNINLRQFADDYTNTLGVGVRYNTPVGPVRFDFGYRVTEVPGVKATQYFVTLGQSF